jgi:molecular chaperone IbpA
MNTLSTHAHWDNLVSAFPHIRRQFVGFDRVIDLLNQNFEPNVNAYPPFNIEKLDEENYEIQMALAGFTDSDLAIEVKEGTLTVEGNQESDSEVDFIHQGIAQRKFKKSWSLADTVVVKGARLTDGILRIALENIIPEEKKAQTIRIKTK